MPKKYIAPIEPPKAYQPSDDPDGKHEFKLGGEDLFLFDLWAYEKTKAEGTECDIWIRSAKKTTADPYYGEPIAVGFDGPFTLRAHVEWPEPTPEVGEEGKTYIWPASVWISRRSLEEAGGTAIVEGDIVRFWKLPYFDNRATAGVKTPGGGYFFDIIKVNEDAHVHDSAMFTGFRCDLSRRSVAPPELNFNTEKTTDDDC